MAAVDIPVVAVVAEAAISAAVVVAVFPVAPIRLVVHQEEAFHRGAGLYNVRRVVLSAIVAIHALVV